MTAPPTSCWDDVAESVPARMPAIAAITIAASVNAQRGRKLLGDLLEHRPASTDRRAEIALDRPADELGVLEIERSIQAKLRSQSRHIGGRGPLAEHDGHRIARHQVAHREDKDRNANQRRDGQRQTPEDIGAQACLLDRGVGENQVTVSMQFCVLNPSLQPDEVVVRPERHPQRLVDDELLDVLVNGQPLVVVLIGSRVVDELVEFGIAVVA